MLLCIRILLFAVKSKHDIEGYKSWSEKQGVVYAEPPEEYLSNTLTDTGVLRVVPGAYKKRKDTI
jgi:hypothetical protein